MKKTYGSLALLALLSSAQAFDYQAHGGVEFFTKIGFNNQGINAQSPNIYPTDTWGSVVARAQVDMDFLTDEQKASGHSLTGSFGVLGGGVIFDLTKDASGNKTYSELFKVGRGDSIVGKEYIADNFVIYNAYLDYTTKIRDHSVEIKVGRYKSKAQFHSGFTQGFEIDYAYKNFNLWWFSSYGRAFAYSEWLYDFYTPKKHGNTYYGVHIFKPSYGAYGFFISPWLQFSPDFYFTPILELGYDSNPGFKGSGFRSQTKIFFMSPFHTTYAQEDYRYQFIAGKGGQTLAIQQRFDVDNFNFGLGWYQNFSNANAHFEVSVPTDGAIQSGYCTIINAYTKRPYAAALAREYILSDEGQINLAKGYARPIRDDVKLPDDVKSMLLPDEQYENARFVVDQEAWDQTVSDLSTTWQEEVVAYAQ